MLNEANARIGEFFSFLKLNLDMWFSFNVLVFMVDLVVLVDECI